MLARQRADSPHICFGKLTFGDKNETTATDVNSFVDIRFSTKPLNKSRYQLSDWWLLKIKQFSSNFSENQCTIVIKDMQKQPNKQQVKSKIVKLLCHGGTASIGNLEAALPLR